VEHEQFSLEIQNVTLLRLLEKAGIEAAEHEKTERLQRLLMEELHHRIKNTLATVQAIASQSLRASETVEQGREAISNRLMALGRVHDFLLQTGGGAAKLASIIGTAIAPFRTHGFDQFEIESSDIDVRADAVLPLALALNELCTNALKYGALSVPAGRVKLTTRVDGNDGRLVLNWAEEDGPGVKEPTRRGFGLRLIELSLSQNLHGRSQIRFAPSGILCELDVPLAAIKPLSSD
jgi:two-component sensor histidine kinase